MEISYDPDKRDRTLRERGLDFLDANRVIDERSITVPDARFDYGELRLITYGWLDDSPVAIVWVERQGLRRVISMRRMHAWEVEYVGLGRP